MVDILKRNAHTRTTRWKTLSKITFPCFFFKVYIDRSITYYIFVILYFVLPKDLLIVENYIIIILSILYKKILDVT